MSFDVRIQLAVLADVPQIATLIEQYWSFEGIAGFDSGQVGLLLEHVLSHPHLGTIWIARAGDALVGYLIGVFVFSFEYHGLVGEIDELFVLPQARSRGVGAALLNVAESSLADGGCNRVQLQIAGANTAARAFYHRRGYAERTGYGLLDKQLSGGA